MGKGMNWDKANKRSAVARQGSAPADTSSAANERNWVDRLNALLRIIGTNHRSSRFAAILLQYAMTHGGLTQKQSIVARRMIHEAHHEPRGEIKALQYRGRRKRKPRLNALPGIVTPPSQPIPEYTGSDAPWEE